MHGCDVEAEITGLGVQGTVRGKDEQTQSGQGHFRGQVQEGAETEPGTGKGKVRSVEFSEGKERGSQTING